jgi:hypothetical protein
MLRSIAQIAVDIGIGAWLARLIHARCESRPRDGLVVANLILFVALAALFRV